MKRFTGLLLIIVFSLVIQGNLKYFPSPFLRLDILLLVVFYLGFFVPFFSGRCFPGAVDFCAFFCLPMDIAPDTVGIWLFCVINMAPNSLLQLFSGVGVYFVVPASESYRCRGSRSLCLLIFLIRNLQKGPGDSLLGLPWLSFFF